MLRTVGCEDRGNMSFRKKRKVGFLHFVGANFRDGPFPAARIADFPLLFHPGGFQESLKFGQSEQDLFVYQTLYFPGGVLTEIREAPNPRGRFPAHDFGWGLVPRRINEFVRVLLSWTWPFNRTG